MQEEVTRFEAQKASTEGELKILQNEIRGKEKPLLAPFEEKEKAARSYYEALATQRGALGERIAREEKERDALKALKKNCKTPGRLWSYRPSCGHSKGAKQREPVLFCLRSPIHPRRCSQGSQPAPFVHQ